MEWFFAVGRLVGIKQIISGKMISKASFDSTFSNFVNNRQVRDRTIFGQLFLVNSAFLTKCDIR